MILARENEPCFISCIIFSVIIKEKKNNNNNAMEGGRVCSGFVVFLSSVGGDLDKIGLKG